LRRGSAGCDSAHRGAAGLSQHGCGMAHQSAKELRGFGGAQQGAAWLTRVWRGSPECIGTQRVRRGSVGFVAWLIRARLYQVGCGMVHYSLAWLSRVRSGSAECLVAQLGAAWLPRLRQGRGCGVAQCGSSLVQQVAAWISMGET
jgi:hypothetical protein